MDKNKGEKRLKLQLQHGFGSTCSKGYKDSVVLSQGDGTFNLIFPIGKYIGFKPLDRQDMSFIKLNENMERIQCMTVSKNRKYIAIAEKPLETSLKNNHYRRPQVSVYTVKYVMGMKFLNVERASLTYQETEGDKFIQMKFSECSRFLLLQTSDYKLLFIDHLNKMREVASGYDLKQEVSKMTINPRESHQVHVTGDKLYQVFNIKEGHFYPQDGVIKRLNYNQNFVDHCWLEDQRIALANDRQDIFIIDQQEVRQVIQDVFQNKYKIGYDISCMISFSKGLIAASKNGNFSVWIKNEDLNLQMDDSDYPLVYLRNFQSERQTEVCAMDIGGSDDILAIAFKNNDIATFDLTKVLPQVQEAIDQYKRNKTLLSRKVYFDYVYTGFHNGPITSIDVCLQRPLVVTVSRMDSTIRIWNYRNFKCELARRFLVDKQSNPDLCPLLCAAIHPCGYILAVGFVDKLRIFHILNNELRPYRELPIKGASVIKFSNGGQYMAVSYPKPKSTTQYYSSLFNAYSFEYIQQTLKAHNSKVTAIVWDPQDKSLATCGNDGCIFEYNNYLENSECISIGHDNVKQINSMIYNENTNVWMISAFDDRAKEAYVFESSVNEKEVQDIRTVPHKLRDTENRGYRINAFSYVTGLHNYNGIIAGLSDGYVCTYPYTFSPYYQEKIAAHDGEINQVAVSPDGQYCFTAGEDGCVFVYQIQEVNEEGHVLSTKIGDKEDAELNPKALLVDPALADVVLVNKEEIDKYLNEQKKLQNDYEDLGNRMDYQTQEEKKRMELQIQEMEDKCKIEIRKWTERYEELKKQKTLIEKESANLLKGMENNHLKAVEELENLYEKKLAFENEKYLQQEQELLEERMNFDRKLKELEQKHEQHINELKFEFNENFHKAQTVYEATKATANELNQHYEEKLDQQEEEHEMEIRELNEKQANQLAEYQDKISDLLSKNDMYKREEKTKEEKMVKVTKKMEEVSDQGTVFKNKLSEAYSQIEVLKADIRKYEDQLQKKEKKIHEYKYKINDLQKSKHVLSFRATEMRKSLEPKEAQIEKLKDELFKLEGEFEAMLKQSQIQNDKMSKMQNQIDTLSKSLKQQIGITNQKENLFNKIVMQIHDCVKETDQKLWNYEMQKMYDTYVVGTKLKSSQHDAKGVEEMSRHIQHLEKSIKQMNNSSEKIIQRREQEVHKKLKENAELIYDLNEMRKFNKELQDQLNNKKTECDNLKKALAEKLNELENNKKKMFNQTANDFNQTNALQRTQQNYKDSKFMGTRPQSMRQTGRQLGKVVKGPTFDAKTLGTFDKAKIMEMRAERELAQNKIIQFEVMLKNVRQKIRRHCQDRNCGDPGLEEEVMILEDQEMGNRMGGMFGTLDSMGGGMNRSSRPQSGLPQQ